ncbi:unnamed protein product, partial [Durusdinium trenchii]
SPALVALPPPEPPAPEPPTVPVAEMHVVVAMAVALEERLRSLELQAHGVCSDRDDLQSSAELAEL